MKERARFSIDHSYSDFRWFRRNRDLPLLVATGRFQEVHYGHILYLREALLVAIKTGCRFRIITGPSDHEFRTQPDLKGARKFFVPFKERRFLLSLLLDIPEKCVVEGLGRPSHEIKSEGDMILKADRVGKHHEQTNYWIENFFHPLDITAVDGISSRITLYVTAKEEDKIYHERHPHEPVHPITLMQQHWNCTEQIKHLAPEPFVDDHGNIIRCSNLDYNSPTIYESAPAAACSATKLIQRAVFGSRFRRVVGRIHKQFEFKKYEQKHFE